MFKLSNKAYNVMKSVAMVWLPASGTLYVALAAIWGLPAAEQVSGSVVAVDTFLGVVLGISTAQFNKTAGAPDAQLLVVEDEGQKHLALGMFNAADVEKMASKDEVRLQVVNKSTES